MLARVSGRTRELAVRMAVGASSSHILRDVLAESVILGFLSGLLGLVLALIGRKLLLQLAPYNPNVEAIKINPAVLAFAALLSAVVGLDPDFCTIPIRPLRADIQHILRSAGDATSLDPGSRFLRHALLVGERSPSRSSCSPAPDSCSMA